MHLKLTIIKKKFEISRIYEYKINKRNFIEKLEQNLEKIYGKEVFLAGLCIKMIFVPWLHFQIQLHFILIFFNLFY